MSSPPWPCRSSGSQGTSIVPRLRSSSRPSTCASSLHRRGEGSTLATKQYLHFTSLLGDNRHVQVRGRYLSHAVFLSFLRLPGFTLSSHVISFSTTTYLFHHLSYCHQALHHRLGCRKQSLVTYLVLGLQEVASRQCERSHGEVDLLFEYHALFSITSRFTRLLTTISAAVNIQRWRCSAGGLVVGPPSHRLTPSSVS